MWQRQLMMTNAMESEYKRDLQDSQGYQKKSYDQKHDAADQQCAYIRRDPSVYAILVVATKKLKSGIATFVAIFVFFLFWEN